MNSRVGVHSLQSMQVMRLSTESLNGRVLASKGFWVLYFYSVWVWEVQVGRSGVQGQL